MIGDHIRALKGGRWEHGIDCGDQTVIHLRDDPGVAPGERVRRTYRPEFLAGAEAVEVVTHRERVYAARQVVARAFSRALDASLAAMFSDSGAFAAWCKTGRLPVARSDAAGPPPGPASRAPAPARRASAARSTRAGARARPVRKAVRAKAAPSKAAAKKRPAPKKKPPAARKAPARAARKSAGRKSAGARKTAQRRPVTRKGKRK